MPAELDTMRLLPLFYIWIFAALVGIAGRPAQAQTTYSASYTYSFVNVPPSWEVPSASAGYIDRTSSGAYPPASSALYNPASPDHLSWKRVCGDGLNGDDDSSGPVNFPTGFAFTFNGVAYNHFRVSTNGSIQFSNVDQSYAPIYTPSPLPYTTSGGGATGCNSSGGPTNVLYAYWRDLTVAPYNAQSGPVRFELKGTAPNRRFIVTWFDVRQFGAATTNFSFQIVLYESPSGINGEFDYRYISGYTNGLGTTIGVQVNGTNWFSYNPSTNSSTANAPIDQTIGTSIRWQAITTPPTPLATYFLNETAYSGTAGEVIDSSGQGKHAVAVGGVTTINISTTCTASGRAVSFPANATASTVTAIQTPVTVSYTGSMNFWYNSYAAWNDGKAAMLFDATDTANTAPFYLMKTPSGQLQFIATPNAASLPITATSPTNSFVANTQKHISISWVFLPGTNQTYVQMFLDGVMVLNKRFTIAPVVTGSTTFFPNVSAFNGTRTFHVGDTRNTVVPSAGTLNSANGWIDDVKIYGSQVNSYIATSDKSCTALVDHLELSASTAAPQPCTTNTITVKACKNAACTLTYNSGLTATLTSTALPAVVWDSATGGATGAGVLTDGAGMAVKSYQVAASGTVTIGVNSPSPLPANNTVCKFGSNASANDCILTVGTDMGGCVADFNCVEAGADPSSGRLFTKLAGAVFNFDVVARKSDGTVSTGYASGGATPVTVALVDGSSSAAACLSGPSALNPAVTSQTLTFAASDNGRKSIGFTVPNAYQSVRCRVTDNNTTTLKGCSQDNFAIRPPGLTLYTTANAAPPPSATAAGNAPMIKAGANFTLYPGNVANHGNNFNGTLTRDTAKLTAQTTVQAATQVGGGTVGTLTPASLIANPATAPANNATYSEVGYLYLAAGAYYDATSPSYTAVDQPPGCAATGTCDCVAASFSDALTSGKYGCNIGTIAASLGRFVPDHFDTAIIGSTAPIACPAAPFTCPVNATLASGLLYANQPFIVQVTAKNAIGAGAPTTNYQGVFAKATALSAWNAVGGNGANPGGGTLSNPTIAANTFAAGVASSATPTYALGSILTVPTDVYFRAVDTDTVTSLRTGAIEAGLKVANGRINVPNLIGSERLGLCVPATVQYYTGSSWTTSLTDSATMFNTNLTTATPTAGNVWLVSGNDLITSGTTPVGCPAPAAGAVTNGVRRFRVASSGGVVGKSVVQVNAPTYLPSAGGTLLWGIYKSPVIDTREVYR